VTTRPHAALAAAALVLAGGAGLIGGPRSADGSLDRPLTALAAEHEVSALEVAEWLRARRADLTILDVRPDSAAFADFHLPRARHEPLTGLRKAAVDTGATIVVYADGGDLAARAWVVLRSIGHRDVRVLPDGVRDWVVELLNPTIAAGAAPEERERFAAQAALSRYFGGLPRVLREGETPDTSATAGLLRTTARRGCAF
jgi:rhodanese-related sulfurtransferase